MKYKEKQFLCVARPFYKIVDSYIELILSTPDDNVKIVQGVPNTSEWKKHVNIFHFESQKEVCFSCEVFWV